MRDGGGDGASDGDGVGDGALVVDGDGDGLMMVTVLLTVMVTVTV